ncbi:hypothetical protein A6A04_13365 [Paramagnetospirillum marisnigri]|uniref:Antirepressor protein ant N-terminal domain-containing protein n=1 Tax=Paramagnetospirillum marisnigri TaxID=1285242 RepID=A0A178MWV7_9PROT|nr:phage antirepressor N-terminal domain-containing protein [Paramagnetospirillum marisnigri]OAN53876.1 hypothetical protein A6A04_13365 [Paramagnetospirillum marisnigri]
MTHSHTTNPTPATVNFCGADILCLWHGSKPHVAVRPISDALGLDWSGQLQRIKRDPVLSATVVVTPTVAADGKTRELITLPLDKMNGWLFGVSAQRVKPEVRDTLIRYQEEAYDVLFRHFYGKALDARPTAVRPGPEYAVPVSAHFRRKSRRDPDPRQLLLPPPVVRDGIGMVIIDSEAVWFDMADHHVGNGMEVMAIWPERLGVEPKMIVAHAAPYYDHSRPHGDRTGLVSDPDGGRRVVNVLGKIIARRPLP